MKTIMTITSILLIQNMAMSAEPKSTKAKNAKTKEMKTVTTQTVTTKEAAPQPHTESSIFSNAGGVYAHELLTHFSSGSFTSQKYCDNCDANNNLNLEASYLRYLKDKIQVGVEAGLEISSTSGNSNTYINLNGVGVYNLDNDLSNSPFLKGGIGLFTVPKDNKTETKFGAFIGGGKRFPLFTNINYSPEARIIKKGDLNIGFDFTLLNFSIHWN